MGTGHLRPRRIRARRDWRHGGAGDPATRILRVAGRGAIVAMTAVLAGISPGQAATPPPVTVARMSLNDLAGQAELICICHMTGQQSEWDGDKNMLVTVVTLEGEEFLKGGDKPGTELVVELFSGFGHEQLNIFGTVFEQGERAVLFLTPAGSAGPAGNDRKRYHIVGWAQGKFTIRTNPKTGEERVERHLEGIHLAPLKTGETSGEMPHTLNELLTAIRTTVTPPAPAPPSP
jgi:hypothetical protein